MRWLSASKSRPSSRAIDEFAVDDTSLGQLARDRLDQLGEVPGQRPLVAAAQLHLVPVAEHDARNPSHFGS